MLREVAEVAIAGDERNIVVDTRLSYEGVGNFGFQSVLFQELT